MEQFKKRPTVLIVDDEPALREVLAEALSAEFRILFAKNGLEALEVVSKQKPDSIILDLLMPEMDGLSVCRRLKADPKTRNIPILILTAHNKADIRIEACSIGAEDFIEKPFRLDELLVRVRAKVANRRDESIQSITDEVRVKPNLELRLDTLNRRAEFKGQRADLKEIEFKILKCLFENFGSVCTRDSLSRVVWGDKRSKHRNLDPHISSLRKKIGSINLNLETIYGAGYLVSQNKE